MLELCIANNIGIKAVEERVLWIPENNNLPPKRNFWQLKTFIKYFLYPLHRRSGWSRQYGYGWKDSSSSALLWQSWPGGWKHNTCAVIPWAHPSLDTRILMHCSDGLFGRIIACTALRAGNGPLQGMSLLLKIQPLILFSVLQKGKCPRFRPWK